MSVKFFPVCAVEDIPQGERLFLEVGETPVGILNVEGEFYAIADVCTHDDGPLGDGDVEDHQIVCPRHGARFDIRSGKALTLPAVIDIPAYPVRITDGQIEVGLPLE